MAAKGAHGPSGWAGVQQMLPAAAAALGRVPTHLASASEPAVTFPLFTTPILFPQGSSVTSGALSPSLHMLSCLKPSLTKSPC